MKIHGLGLTLAGDLFADSDYLPRLVLSRLNLFEQPLQFFAGTYASVQSLVISAKP